jgi:PAS domain S-box-containing protein
VRESEERLRLTLEATNDGIWDWNIPTGAAVFSPRWYTMLDYEPYELPQTYDTWKRLVHPDDADRAAREIKEGIAKGKGYAIEIRMRTKSGGWRWILTRGGVVERDADGDPIRMVGTHTDITERKTTEQEVRRLNRLYYVLSQVNQAITRIQSRDELLSTVCRLVIERGTVDLAWIGWFDPETSRINPVAHSGNQTKMLSNALFCANDCPEGQGNLGKAIREGRTFVCNQCGSNPCRHPEHAPARFGSRSCGSFPLRFGGKVCGALSLCMAQPGFFREREVSLLEEVTTSISFALDKLESSARRKRAEQALRESEERLSLTLSASQMGVWEWDVRTGAVFGSPECHKIFGTQSLGANFESFTAFIHPEDLADARMNITQALKERTAYRDEFRIIRPDGEVRWVSGIGRAEYDPDGEPLRLRGISQDITERKEFEEERRLIDAQLRQAQKLESIGQLAAGIAHEINTPTQYVGDNTRFLLEAFNDLIRLLDLYAKTPQAIKAGKSVDDLIRTMRDAAEEADLDYLREEIPKAIKQALDGVERVSKIVQAMKEFSHPGSTEKKEIDVNRAIESTITVARNEWKYVADLIMDLDPALPPVSCLPGEFNQVILNMIINACHAITEAMQDKSGEKGTITVKTLDLGTHVKILISDTGTGIPEQIRSKIFDPFFTTKEVGRGTGQGLAISYSVIVKKHHGTISFESEVGKGTTFFIDLPVTGAA